MQTLLQQQDTRKSFSLIAEAVKSLDKLTADTDKLRGAIDAGGVTGLDLIRIHLVFLVECLQVGQH